MHHERDFFEVANEVSAVLDRDFSNFRAAVVDFGQYRLKGLFLEKTAAHGNELVRSVRVVLPRVLEQTLPQRDEGNAASHDDRYVFDKSNIHWNLL